MTTTTTTREDDYDYDYDDNDEEEEEFEEEASSQIMTDSSHYCNCSRYNNQNYLESKKRRQNQYDPK